MIKSAIMIPISGTGLLGMESGLHAQGLLVETPMLHISEDGEGLARRVVQLEPTAGAARMVTICHANGDIWVGFAADAATGLGRPLPRIRIVRESGAGKVFDAHVVKHDDGTIVFFAAPTNMRMSQRRPTELIEGIARFGDFSVAPGFSGEDVAASFDGHVAGLTALYVAAFCDFDPLD